MAYASTLVTYGTGAGVVVDIGDQTQIGQISEMIATVEVLDTPLTRKIGIALLLFVVGLKLDLEVIRTVGPVPVATGLG